MKPWKRAPVPKPPDHQCGHPYQACRPCEAITAAQQRIARRPVTLRTRDDYRRQARWWELEALRGYASSASSLRYALNLRWAAELAGIYGYGTWLELLERSGNANPEPGGTDPDPSANRATLDAVLAQFDSLRAREVTDGR